MQIDIEDHKMIPSENDAAYVTNQNLVDKEEPGFARKEQLGLELS